VATVSSPDDAASGVGAAADGVELRLLPQMNQPAIRPITSPATREIIDATSGLRDIEMLM
jgi:hypothetical protein